MSTRIHAKAATIYKDEIDYSGVSNGVVIDIDNPPAEVTAFADVDATFVEGKAVFKINLNALFDAVASGFDAEMFSDLTSENRRVGVYPEGRTVGTPGYEGRTDISQAPRTAEKAGAILLNVTWQGDTPLARARILATGTAIASTTTGTKYQHGDLSSTQTGVGVLRLLAAPGGAGSNACVVTIESDADSIAGGETTRITFATLNQVSVALHEVVEVAGAVTDAWWRAVVTISGAGTRTFNLLISFGIRAT